MSNIVIATYDKMSDAHQAITELLNDGFDREHVGLAANNVTEEFKDVLEEVDADVDGEDGAEFGGIIGAIVGAVAGLTAITIPGIGPIVAAGPLAALIGGATGAGIGAATGAVTGGVTAKLVDSGIPEADADYYAEALRRGAVLVAVTAEDENTAQRAIQVMQKHSPVNIDHRLETWREDGWERYDPDAPHYTAEEIALHRERYANRDANDTIPDPLPRYYPLMPPY